MTEFIQNFEKRNPTVKNDDANTFSDVINELYGKENSGPARPAQNPFDRLVRPAENEKLPEHSDLFKHFDKHKNEGKEQVEKVLPLSDREVEESAKRIASLIGRNGDFSYGGKNEKIRDAFSQAAAAGKESFDRLVEAVNKQLADSGLSLKANYSLETEKKLRDLGDVALMSYPPIYPNARFEQTTKALVDLSLLSKAGEEDSLKLERVISRMTVKGTYSPTRRELGHGELKE